MGGYAMTKNYGDGKCKHCNKDFKITKPRQVYCDRLTCTRVQRNRDKKKLERDSRPKNYCLVCNEDISHKLPSAKTCSVNCRNKMLRKNQETDRKCRECGTSINHMHYSAYFCCGEHRQNYNNRHRYTAKEYTMRKCKCCGKEFETRSSSYCSKTCRNIKVGEWKKCKVCKKDFITSIGSRKATCSSECTTNWSEVRAKEHARIKTKATRTYKKAKTIKKGTKARVTPKKTPTVKPKIEPKVKEVKPKVKVPDKNIEVPMFKSEPVPKVTPKDSLTRAIAERNKKKGFTSEDKMKAMQDKWLKKNKPKIIEPVPVKYEPYSGKEKDTRQLTTYGLFTKMGGSTSEDRATYDTGV